MDANVFLRLGIHSKSSDIFDYLTSTHAAPLILPGQAVQEFWNNQLQAVDPIAGLLKRKLSAFQQDVSKIDSRFGGYRDQFNAAISTLDELVTDFSIDHGHVYDEATAHRILTLLDLLQTKALVPYAQRTALRDVAMERKRSKTPPGFRDEGDGDFFVWADFLTGLEEARARELPFSRVALISHDQKPDWSRAGMAHPILVAEVRALFDVPFEIWTIEKLVDEISRATA
ncbi:MAG: PIN-like domain-containing protein [Devosia sp.]|nr:PIN-like domain-containing protein [Devosia sp.]